MTDRGQHLANEPGAAVAEVGGVPFRITNLDSAVEWALDAAARRSPVSIRLSNAYCVALASTDSAYFALLSEEGVNFPDGQPVVDLLRLTVPRDLRGAVGRVRGPSFFVRALQRSADVGVSNYFVGATPQTLDLLVARARQEFPQLKVAGSYAPPFAAVDDAFLNDIISQIKVDGPTMIWVGLGTPKQDIVAKALAEAHQTPAAGVGAAFDFLAGTVREAPVWIQRSRLEWLFRLLSEPKRLARRYVFGNSRFLLVSAMRLRAARRSVVRVASGHE